MDVGSCIDPRNGSDHGPIRVRIAGVADAPAIAAVHVSTWEGAYRGMIPDDFLDRRTVARQTSMWEEILGGAGDPVSGQRPWVAVAERDDGEDGAVIGFASLNVPSREDAGERTAEISALYVEPARWRGGTGSALMAAALAEAAGRGCTTVTLWVLEPNTRARAFYERCGFTDDGARQTVDDSWPVELRMRRAVPEQEQRSTGEQDRERPRGERRDETGSGEDGGLGDHPA